MAAKVAGQGEPTRAPPTGVIKFLSVEETQASTRLGGGSSAGADREEEEEEEEEEGEWWWDGSGGQPRQASFKALHSPSACNP